MISSVCDVHGHSSTLSDFVVSLWCLYSTNCFSCWWKILGWLGLSLLVKDCLILLVSFLLDKRLLTGFPICVFFLGWCTALLNSYSDAFPLDFGWWNIRGNYIPLRMVKIGMAFLLASATWIVGCFPCFFLRPDSEKGLLCSGHRPSHLISWFEKLMGFLGRIVFWAFTCGVCFLDTGQIHLMVWKTSNSNSACIVRWDVTCVCWVLYWQDGQIV